MPESFQSDHEQRLRRGKPPLSGERVPKQKEAGKIPTYEGHRPEAYRSRVEAVHGPEFARSFETVLNVCRDVKKQGGRALLVGGSVRDEVLGEASNDFDLEIYGLEPEAVENIISQHGKVDAVGKAFGILILSNDESAKIDISLPRTDSKIAEGHKGFQTKADPQMSIWEAAKRRDFTFNALAKDPLTGEIFDPFGGIEDLRQRVLRVTDRERFADDPLRVLRGAQFVARFGLRVDEQSREIMAERVPELKQLSKERFLKEWDKLLLLADKPSLGLMFMHDLGVISQFYPELHALQATPQEFDWHPEGDVWVHTLMVVDTAAEVSRYYRLNQQTKRVVMWASLCHDLGKPPTTSFEEGRVRSRGHESAGEDPTRTLMQRLGMDKDTAQKVIAIVKDHLWPGAMYLKQKKGESVTDGAFRRLAERIAPATIAELTFTAEADHRGRGPFLDPTHIDQFILPDPFAAGEWVRRRAEEIGVYKEKPQPVFQGRDLIALGYKPGRAFGTLIALGNDQRDTHGRTREELIDILRNCPTIEQAISALQDLTLTRNP